MKTGSATPLRLYCICGQKMRVSEDMFGRPGKCVACRQKIRIPRRDELPGGTTQLHLKDHPEFLRKNKKKRPSEPKPSDEIKSREEAEAAPQPDDELRSVVPIDTLEPLRVLCSLEKKVNARLASMDEGGASASDRAEWQGYLARIELARNELDEQLRQRLMEVAIELANTQEKIAETGLSARVGEIDYVTFRDTIGKLRERRDRLEKRQLNLRGWLATRDPYTAGGYVDLPMNAIPGPGRKVTLPQDDEMLGSPLTIFLEELRHAFEAKERADRKIAESRKMTASGNVSEASIKNLRREEEGARQRAQSAIRFHRDRLKQLMEDYDADVQAINAQMELARGRLQVGEIDRTRFDRIEKDLIKARTDMVKARALVRRALSADSARAVPTPAGTFIERIARASRDGMARDSWIAIGAALLLLLTIVLPSIGGVSPITAFMRQNDSAYHWVVSGPLVASLMVFAFALIPVRTGRGIAVSVLWVFMAIASSILIHQQGSSAGAMAQMFRATSPFSLGFVAFLGALAAMLAAAWVALWPDKRYRPILGSAIAAVVVIVPLVLTDFGGFLRAEPDLIVPAVQADAEEGTYTVPITVRNTGGRTFSLGRESTAVHARLVVERKQGANSWVPIQGATEVEDGAGRSPGLAAQLAMVPIAPGGDRTFVYQLPPGEYRASLIGGPLVEAMTQEFELEAIQPEEPEPVEQEPPMPVTDDDTARPDPVLVELKGQLMIDGHPQFIIQLTKPDGEVIKREVGLLDELYRGWILDEYRPQDQSLLLRHRDMDELVAVRPGEPTELAP